MSQGCPLELLDDQDYVFIKVNQIPNSPKMMFTFLQDAYCFALVALVGRRLAFAFSDGIFYHFLGHLCLLIFSSSGNRVFYFQIFLIYNFCTARSDCFGQSRVTIRAFLWVYKTVSKVFESISLTSN